MKKALATLVVGILLTLPIYFGLTSIPALARWFASGTGWDAMTPVFRLFHSAGGEQNEDILFASFLLISFLFALIVSALIVRMLSRMSRAPEKRKA